MISYKVIVEDMKGFNSAEQQKFKDACQLLENIIISDSFTKKVLATNFTESNGMSPRQILDLLLSGKDNHNQLSDNALNVYVNLYYQNTSTIGYTYANNIWTWINRKFFSKMTPGEIAGNILHEYMHRLGFGHIRRWFFKSKMLTTVPYQMGIIVEELAGEME
jgi:hypothetical protein